MGLNESAGLALARATPFVFCIRAPRSTFMEAKDISIHISEPGATFAQTRGLVQHVRRTAFMF